MAVAFTENEKIIIRKKLIQAAEECLEKYGVRKTTVDQLVKMAGISKGAFYLFFDSKEILFFEVLENFQKQIFQDILQEVDATKARDKQLFVEVMLSLILKVKKSFLINIIKTNELELIFRKLPEEVLLKHDDFDETIAENLISKFNLNNKIDKFVMTAALRTIFMALLHEKEIGIYFDEALKILLTGFANSIFMEGENDNSK